MAISEFQKVLPGHLGATPRPTGEHQFLRGRFGEGVLGFEFGIRKGEGALYLVHWSLKET